MEKNPTDETIIHFGSLTTNNRHLSFENLRALVYALYEVGPKATQSTNSKPNPDESN